MHEAENAAKKAALMDGERVSEGNLSI